MIIDCRQDGRRTAQGGEGIEVVASRIRFVGFGAEIGKSAALTQGNIGRGEVGINVVANWRKKSRSLPAALLTDGYGASSPCSSPETPKRKPANVPSLGGVQNLPLAEAAGPIAR
jgi:hypothetical protein